MGVGVRQNFKHGYANDKRHCSASQHQRDGRNEFKSDKPIKRASPKEYK